MPRKDIRFRLLARDPCGARRGSLKTAHGLVDTPAFMPVGTQGAVKSATPDQVAATGAQVILANTYHLSLGRRRETVKRAGGLHTFMAWPRTILTDSGGFQVFSLTGRRVSDKGVTFPGADGGGEVFMDAETSMAVQRDLGADIVMAFDECVHHESPRAEVEKAVERTTAWAWRCRESPLADHQFLFGIVQGGVHEDLRRRSAEEITAIPFDGYAVGGVSVGEGHDLMVQVTRWTAPHLPAQLPRYLMGVGLPEDILAAVACGMDMFDCVIPTRYARGGTLFTRTGRIRIGDKRYRKDRYPADTACRCYTCTHFSRMVLRHLSYAGEPLFQTLATLHNLHFYQDLMRDIRVAVEGGAFQSFHADWLQRYRSGGPGRRRG